MTLRVEFHPAAEDEILTALSWYAERSNLAASAFLHEVNLVVERMTEAPHRWPKFLRDTRRIVFPRFPSVLFIALRPMQLRSSLSLIKADGRGTGEAGSKPRPA